jgi:hypothetical protein
MCSVISVVIRRAGGLHPLDTRILKGCARCSGTHPEAGSTPFLLQAGLP